MMLRRPPSGSGRQTQQLPGRLRQRSSGRLLRGTPARKQSAPGTAPAWRSALLLTEGQLCWASVLECDAGVRNSHQWQRCNGVQAAQHSSKLDFVVPKIC